MLRGHSLWAAVAIQKWSWVSERDLFRIRVGHYTFWGAVAVQNGPGCCEKCFGRLVEYLLSGLICYCGDLPYTYRLSEDTVVLIVVAAGVVQYYY